MPDAIADIHIDVTHIAALAAGGSLCFRFTILAPNMGLGNFKGVSVDYILF